MREKSLETRILLSRSFHLSGHLRASLGGFRCCPATIVDRPRASISTAMWSDILPGRTVPEDSCGRARLVSAIWAFYPAAIIAELATSMIWMRLPEHLGARPVSVPSCGRKAAACAISERCREIRRVRRAQSIIMEMSLGTRKVHGGCALFCGLKQLECRIWGCSPVETPAERLGSTTWVLWLEVRQARREIAPLFGQKKQG